MFSWELWSSSGIQKTNKSGDTTGASLSHGIVSFHHQFLWESLYSKQQHKPQCKWSAGSSRWRRCKLCGWTPRGTWYQPTNLRQSVEPEERWMLYKDTLKKGSIHTQAVNQNMIWLQQQLLVANEEKKQNWISLLKIGEGGAQKILSRMLKTTRLLLKQ